jgi:hypothetical protein
MWCFFEYKNYRKSILRMGAVDHGTVELEKLLVLNSFAESLGYEPTELPYPGLSAPKTRSATLKEYIGFNYAPPSVDDVSNPTAAQATAAIFETVYDDEAVIANTDTEAPGNDDDFADYLQDIYGDNADVDTLVDDADFCEATEHDTGEVARQLEIIDLSEEAARIDAANAIHIRQEINRLLPDATAKESTYEAFKRFTNNAPWIPLRNPRSSTVATTVDSEEAAVFTKLLQEGNFKRKCSATNVR